MTRSQRYFEDVQVGEEMPPLIKTPSRVQLFMYSAISWNLHRIHYDKEYAASEGHQDVLVHGPLQGAFLGQYMTDWGGPEARLRKIGWTNRGRAFVEQPYIIKGRITGKQENDDLSLVDCEVWSENEAGERLLGGIATISLPRRS
jgi:hydroxyacyl-ACP dehydratase HTD2-like protein with hotdog domain